MLVPPPGVRGREEIRLAAVLGTGDGGDVTAGGCSRTTLESVGLVPAHQTATH